MASPALAHEFAAVTTAQIGVINGGAVRSITVDDALARFNAGANIVALDGTILVGSAPQGDLIRFPHSSKQTDGAGSEILSEQTRRLISQWTAKDFGTTH